MTKKSKGDIPHMLEPHRVEFIVLGITIATLIGGAFLMGFNAGYSLAILYLL